MLRPAYRRIAFHATKALALCDPSNSDGKTKKEEDK
jgi:hypothetical protein